MGASLENQEALVLGSCTKGEDPDHVDQRVQFVGGDPHRIGPVENVLDLDAQLRAIRGLRVVEDQSADRLFFKQRLLGIQGGQDERSLRPRTGVGHHHRAVRPEARPLHARGDRGLVFKGTDRLVLHDRHRAVCEGDRVEGGQDERTGAGEWMHEREISD